MTIGDAGGFSKINQPGSTRELAEVDSSQRSSQAEKAVKDEAVASLSNGINARSDASTIPTTQITGAKVGALALAGAGVASSNISSSDSPSKSEQTSGGSNSTPTMAEQIAAASGGLVRTASDFGVISEPIQEEISKVEQEKPFVDIQNLNLKDLLKDANSISKAIVKEEAIVKVKNLLGQRNPESKLEVLKKLKSYTNCKTTEVKYKDLASKYLNSNSLKGIKAEYSTKLGELEKELEELKDNLNSNEGDLEKLSKENSELKSLNNEEKAGILAKIKVKDREINTLKSDIDQTKASIAKKKGSIKSNKEKTEVVSNLIEDFQKNGSKDKYTKLLKQAGEDGGTVHDILKDLVEKGVKEKEQEKNKDCIFVSGASYYSSQEDFLKISNGISNNLTNLKESDSIDSEVLTIIQKSIPTGNSKIEILSSSEKNKAGAFKLGREKFKEYVKLKNKCLKGSNAKDADPNKKALNKFIQENKNIFEGLKNNNFFVDYLESKKTDFESKKNGVMNFIKDFSEATGGTVAKPSKNTRSNTGSKTSRGSRTPSSRGSRTPSSRGSDSLSVPSSSSNSSRGSDTLSPPSSRGSSTTGSPPSSRGSTDNSDSSGLSSIEE